MGFALTDHMSLAEVLEGTIQGRKGQKTQQESLGWDIEAVLWCTILLVGNIDFTCV